MSKEKERKVEYTTIGKAGGSGGKSLRLKSDLADYIEIDIGDYVAVYKEIDPRTKEKILIVKKAKS